MSDYRTVLERARREFPAPDMELDAIVRRRRRREVKRRVGTAVLALAVSAAAFGGLIRALSPAAPGPAEERKPLPSCTAFERACGWIAYNDGTGIWAVDPGKAYPGTFSPTKFPDDTVRLAGSAAGDPIAWSADGSRLLVRRPGSAFIIQRQALFVLDPDGTETRVAGSDPPFKGASISPDGTRVVYVAGAHPSRLEVATVGDAPPEVLLSTVEGHLDSPAFSPDSGRIAFIDGGGDHANALWVIDADGTNRRKLAGGDWAHVDGLVWSPDGERLAFSCRCPGGTGVYTIRADGTRFTLVSADEEMPVPQWSPDGSQIALVHAHNSVIIVGQPTTTTATLVVVGAEGGEERQLIHFELALLEGENPRRLTIAWNPAG
jgi:Tol biopolymer transport system component